MNFRTVSNCGMVIFGFFLNGVYSGSQTHTSIHEFQGFGWEMPREKVAEVMGGRVVLLGNVSPILLRDGTPAEVKRETLACLDLFAPRGGYIVQDGNNIAPGTPVANINAMTEAAEDYGRRRA